MTLKLNHVLSREVGTISDDELLKVATMFDNYLVSKKFTKYGPLILKNTITNEGLKATLMMQIRDSPASVDEPFEFNENIIEENTIVVRFSGPERYLSIAQSKGAVFAFENDLTLSGVTYTVIKERKDGEISADLFFCTE